MKKKLCVLLLGLCLVSISACGNKGTSGTSDNIPASSYTGETTTAETTTEADSNASDKKLEKNSDEKENNKDISENAENKEANTNEKLVDGMRPEFKEAMDSYEAFYDEYCDILKKYTKNPSDMQLLTDYTNMLTKAAEVSEKFDAWENNELNDIELKYYFDVNNRVTQKLLEAAE